MSEAADRLLAPDDPLPVRVLRPEGRSDFVVTADHAGRAIPKRLGMLGLPEDELARHIAWDIGIAGVTERLSEALGAAAVLQNYSRLVIDCNRQPGLDSSIPTISELTAIPGNEGLSSDEREARQREIFQPYHARIEQLLESRSASGRRTLLIAMHSFTPVFKSVARKVDIGVLYNRDARLPYIMLDLLRHEGDLNVGDNQPAGTWRTAWAAACRDRDPPGSNRRCGGPGGLGGAPRATPVGGRRAAARERHMTPRNATNRHCVNDRGYARQRTTADLVAEIERLTGG